MQTSDVTLSIKPDLLDRINREVIRRVIASELGCSERNQILRDYQDQADGMGQPFSANQPWDNSSLIVDPLTEDQITGMKAYLSQAVASGEPRCLITAVRVEDQEYAANLESAFSAKCEQWQVERMLIDLIHYVAAYPYAPLRVDWEQKLTKVRQMEEIDPATGTIIDAENAQAFEGVETETKPTVEPKVLVDAPKIIAIAPDHFYLFPPTCQNIDDAQLVIEKIYLTREDLYLGIDDYGYDKEAVMTLLAGGPTASLSIEDSRSTRNERDGLEDAGQDGYYVCAIVVGRMPLLMEGEEVTTPKRFLREDFVWLCCPTRQVTFKFGPAAYPFRTYDVANMDRYPNRMMGQCVTSKLQVIQEEMTAVARSAMNVAEFVAQPVILRNTVNRNDQDGQEVFPGATLWYTGAFAPTALQWDQSGVQTLMEQVEFWDQRGKELVGSGQGIEQPTQHDTTATEVSQVGASGIMRRDLFLTTFLNTLDRVYMLIAMMWFSAMSDDGETVITPSGPVELSKEGIADRFIFKANANRQAGNPQIRLQQDQFKQQVQLQYFGSLGTFPPQFWGELYHGARVLLQSVNVRGVEGWIGKDPSLGMDPAAILTQVMQLLQQAAATDPAAGQILQIITQQMQQQGQQPQQGQLPPGQEQGMLPAGGVPQAQPGPGAALPVDVGQQGLVASGSLPYQQNGVH